VVLLPRFCHNDDDSCILEVQHIKTINIMVKKKAWKKNDAPLSTFYEI
jgi:hypothetical protein